MAEAFSGVRCMGISLSAPTPMRWLLARWSLLPYVRLHLSRGKGGRKWGWDGGTGAQTGAAARGAQAVSARETRARTL